MGSLSSSGLSNETTCLNAERSAEASMVGQLQKFDHCRRANRYRHRFKEVDFLIIFFGSALACFPLFIPPYFIPIFARSISQSGNIAIIGLTIWNIASTVGRVCAGYTADSLLGPLNSFLVSLVCCAVSSLAIWPFSSNMGVLAAFAVINGIGCGSFFSLFPTVLGSVFGAENTMGVLPIMWGGWFFGFFFVSPVLSRSITLVLTVVRELPSLRSSTRWLERGLTPPRIDLRRITQVPCRLLASFSSLFCVCGRLKDYSQKYEDIIMSRIASVFHSIHSDGSTTGATSWMSAR